MVPQDIEKCSFAKIEKQFILYYLERNQVRLASLVPRMLNHCTPKQLLYRKLTKRKRPAHKPRLRLKNTFKKTPDEQGFDTKTWKSLTSNRIKWRGWSQKTSGQQKKRQENGSKRLLLQQSLKSFIRPVSPHSTIA